MTESPPEQVRTPGRGRIIAARILVVLGILLLVVSLLANFVKREALDEDHFRQTSEELIANDTIRNEVAATMVDRLYENVDVAAELKGQLPSNLQRLSGPIAGVSRELADRAAREILDRPALQQVFVDATSLAQAQFIAVLEDDSKAVSTTGGNVVLDIRPLVLELGDRFQFVSNLADRIPQDSAQVTILKSEDLETAQNLTQWLKAVANWIWVLVLVCWAIAIWLVPGRRRLEVRAIGIGLIVAGALVLVIRSAAGTYFVDNVVSVESVRPAASEVWRILTDSLASSAWVTIWVGVLAAIGAWLTGEGRRSVSSRRWLAPHLRRAGVAYAGFAVLLLIALWLLPVQEVRTELLLVILSVIGFEVLRNQVARETPAPAVAAAKVAVRDRLAVMRPKSSSKAEELERLAKLHDSGALSDEEFAAAKADLLG
jgi:hypothetical protein